MLEVSFDVMQSAALAALVAMVGRGIVKRVKFFQTYCIPGVIVAGLIVSFILGILRSAGLLSVHFEVTVLKEWFMDIFFTGVGLTASWALIKKGGKVCIGITITTIGLILGQDILGRPAGDAPPPRPGTGLPVSDGRRGYLQRHRPLL